MINFNKNNLDNATSPYLQQHKDNPKHRLMISLLYAAGLRVSELLHLRLKDISFENNYDFVRQG